MYACIIRWIYKRATSSTAVTVTAAAKIKKNEKKKKSLKIELYCHSESEWVKSENERLWAKQKRKRTIMNVMMKQCIQQSSFMYFIHSCLSTAFAINTHTNTSVLRFLSFAWHVKRIPLKFIRNHTHFECIWFQSNLILCVH